MQSSGLKEMWSYESDGEMCGNGAVTEVVRCQGCFVA